MLIAWPGPAYAVVQPVQAYESAAPMASAPGGELQTAPDLPVPIRALLQHPAGDEHQSRTVEGVVARITEHSGDEGSEPPTLLLRDAAGDTISVVGATVRVALGAHVRVNGRIERDVAGNARIVAAGQDLLVLRRPTEEIPTASSQPLRPAPTSMGERRQRVVGVLGASAAMLLLGGIVLRNRWRSREESPIPLIVDLAVLQASAPSIPSPAAPHYPAAIRPAAGDLASPVAEPVDRSPAADLPAGPAVRQAEPRTEPPLDQVERNVPREPTVRRIEPAVHQVVPAVWQAGAVTGQASPVVTIPADPRLHGNGNDPILELDTAAPLQLLPGMLEIIEGADGPSQIRFFRTAALEAPELTLGRAHGPPYRHIHLWAPSVSRMHARMRFEGKRWKISNLSETNPLRVNDQVIAAADESHTLADGDEIHLGEVRLRYRES